MGRLTYENIRVSNKHDIEENWNKSDIIPLDGELIIYDPDENYNYYRIKFGDGYTRVSGLDFVISGSLEDLASKEYVNNQINNISEVAPEALKALEELSKELSENGDLQQTLDLIKNTAGQKENGGEIFNLYEDTKVNVGTIGGTDLGEQNLSKNIASNYSHAEGAGTEATGKVSHAEGILTKVTGDSAHTEGVGTLVTASAAHGEGLGMSYTLKVSAVSNNIITVQSTKTGTEKIAELELIKDNGIIWYEKNSTNHTGEFYCIVDVEKLKTLNILTSCKLTLDRVPTITKNAMVTVIMGGALTSASHKEGNFSSTVDLTATNLKGEGENNNQHAEGLNTIAAGDAAHSEGYKTLGLGAHSHAEGEKTQAVGKNSHTEGLSSIASAENAHAEGLETRAAGKQSHTEGYNTITSAENTHAEGHTTQATADNAHAEGYETIANGNSSHAGGYRTITKQFAQTAIGTFNSDDADALFIVGNGTDEEHRQNAFVVNKNGYAEVQSTNATCDNSVVNVRYLNATTSNIGKSTSLAGEVFNDYDHNTANVYAHAEGQNTNASGQASHTEGTSTKTNATNAHAEGQETEANGMNSHTEGYQTVATGFGAHAEGGNTTSSNEYTHTEGFYTAASGMYSHAEGRSTQAIATASHAEGYITQASGENSHAEGSETVASAHSAHAGGWKTKATAFAQTAIGTANAEDANALFIIGNGTEDNARSNIFVVRNNMVDCIFGNITISIREDGIYKNNNRVVTFQQ